MIERTDVELLRDYAENKAESSFSELVRRHADLVYSAARRQVVDQHLAEDVAQATFATLAREARHLTDHVALVGWLHRTACNIAANVVRSEVRRREREKEAATMQSLQSGPDPDWQALSPVLDLALNQLGEMDRALILLRYFQKQTAREIGLMLKLKEEAAQKRISRALARLRTALVGRGVTIPIATLGSFLSTYGVNAAPVGFIVTASAAGLAGSSLIGGLSAATTKLIIMSKLKMTAGALLILSMAAPLYLQYQGLLRLREQNAGLQRRLLALETAPAPAAAAQTLQLTDTQLSELLRLRGEVGLLRKESQELARLRSQSAGAPPAKSTPKTGADFLQAAAWANVGAEEPASAIQTFLWAGRQGETNLVRNLLRWQRDSAIPASEELDQNFAQGLIAGTTRFAGTLESFRITRQEPESNNLVRLDIEMVSKNGKTESHQLRLVREENQWFPVMHVWLQDSGSVRAALDAPAQWKTR